MDTFMQGIPHVICYLDDILVTGTEDVDHMKNLRTVFQRLQDHGSRLKRGKCSFIQDSVEYLGHKIYVEGIHTHSEKVASVVDVLSTSERNYAQIEKEALSMVPRNITRTCMVGNSHLSLTTSHF